MKIIIDTDPGQDDALTILLALASPEIKLLGVTTVAGNVPVAQTTENALKTLDLVGRTDIPVHAGADRPLLRPGVTATHVHGKTGFEGVDLPPPSREATPVTRLILSSARSWKTRRAQSRSAQSAL